MDDAYAKLLDQAGAADAWRQKFRPVLGPLAVAGPGPVLPLPLLARASKELGGPEDVEGVRSVLAALRGLVVRRDAGTPREHAGLFHPTLAEYLLGPSAASAGYTLDAEAAHRAMVQAIEALAPMDKHDRDDPLHRYAFLREADHLWALDDMDRTLACLRSRDCEHPEGESRTLAAVALPVPGSIRRGPSDHPGFARLGLRHWTGAGGRRAGRCNSTPTCCRTRSVCWAATTPTRSRPAITSRTGPARRATRGALQLFTALLPDRERVLGRDHPDTLATRGNIAAWTGEVGDARGALRLFTELLPDQERVLGRDHPDTLTTRNNIARWTGEAGKRARRCNSPPRCCRTRSVCWAATTPTRSPHAATSRTGPARRATRAGVATFAALLPDQERVLGRDHPNTLATRGNIAAWTGEVGDARGALQLYSDLLPDQERVLGRDHPDTLTARNNIAHWTGAAGDARGALQLFAALLPDRERVLGRDHPDTLAARNNIAHWTGAVGDARGALQLFTALLPDQERVLGRDHPDTLTTRGNIAHWTGKVGDARGALRLFTELLPEWERVLGRDHLGTLTTRSNIALWTSESGDAREALQLFAALLPDQERVLGRDHPETLTTRNNIALWTGELGDAPEALQLFAALLPDLERVLGRDHPDTLTTRGNIAHWTGVVGDARGALRLFTELLPERERVLGRDHPETLGTLGLVGIYAILCGASEEGCRCLREGLTRVEARFGPDHPLTRTFQNLIRNHGCGGDGPGRPVTPGPG